MRLFLLTIALASVPILAGASVTPTASSCSPADVETIKTALRLKRIRNEYETILDLLRPIRHELRNIARPAIERPEICMEFGALVHRIPFAIGITCSHDPYARNPDILKLMAQLREESIALSEYCENGAEAAPGDPLGLRGVVTSLDHIASLRDELVKLL